MEEIKRSMEATLLNLVVDLNLEKKYRERIKQIDFWIFWFEAKEEKMMLYFKFAINEMFLYALIFTYIFWYFTYILFNNYLLILNQG